MNPARRTHGRSRVSGADPEKGRYASDDDALEYLTSQERAALALWLLIQVPMSTREIAERCGMQMAGAWKMLNLISRVVPLYRDGGKWRILRIS